MSRVEDASPRPPLRHGIVYFAVVGAGVLLGMVLGVVVAIMTGLIPITC